MAPEPRILPRVLVVDDDRLNREIARDALGASAEVVCCASGEAALEELRREPADLVVERILSRRRLLAENERLREALRVAESCRTLLRCLDPGEVYAVALDLLLHALPCERGLAIFRRTSFPSSDGVAFRGFDESEARQLRQALVVRNTPHPPPILPPRP